MSRLRQRPGHINNEEDEQDQQQQRNSSNTTTNGMAYARPARPALFHSHRGALNNSNNNNPSSFFFGGGQSQYRTKIIFVITITSMYTAFLYRSGVCERSRKRRR